MELDTKIKCLMAALQLLLHIKTHTHTHDYIFVGGYEFPTPAAQLLSNKTLLTAIKQYTKDRRATTCWTGETPAGE